MWQRHAIKDLRCKSRVRQTGRSWQLHAYRGGDEISRVKGKSLGVARTRDKGHALQIACKANGLELKITREIRGVWFVACKQKALGVVETRGKELALQIACFQTDRRLLLTRDTN